MELSDVIQKLAVLKAEYEQTAPEDIRKRGIIVTHLVNLYITVNSHSETDWKVVRKEIKDLVELYVPPRSGEPNGNL